MYYIAYDSTNYLDVHAAGRRSMIISTRASIPGLLEDLFEFGSNSRVRKHCDDVVSCGMC